MASKIKLLIGLGNPHKDYENTYHNAGCLFVNYLKKQILVTSARLPAGQGYTPVASTVYMNESGRFVIKMLKKTGVKPEELAVAHDDSDIFLGEYKFSFGRGAGGHQGVASIIKTLGTKNFYRLRIGIRSEKTAAGRRKKASEFVLKKISVQDLKKLKNIFEKIKAELLN